MELDLSPIPMECMRCHRTEPTEAERAPRVVREHRPLERRHERGGARLHQPQRGDEQAEPDDEERQPDRPWRGADRLVVHDDDVLGRELATLDVGDVGVRRLVHGGGLQQVGAAEVNRLDGEGGFSPSSRRRWA